MTHSYESTFAASCDLAPSPFGFRQDGSPVAFDLRRLQGPHFFIQGGTGSGKTTTTVALVTQAIEQEMPVCIFDVEGQFPTLQKTYPHFIVIGGPSDDVLLDPATIRSVVEVAYRNRSSFIIRLDEVSLLSDRRKIVSEALTAMMEMPSSQRHKRLVLIDEVHLFAPQKGASEAAHALAEAAGRGRKRGLILLLATQRFARTDKDIVSQCLNVMVGRNQAGADLQAALNMLALPSQAGVRLQRLQRGTFLAVGPDFGNELTDIHVAKPDVELSGEVDNRAEAAVQFLPRERQISEMRSASEGKAVSPGDVKPAEPATKVSSSAPVLQIMDAMTMVSMLLANARVKSIPVATIQLLLRPKFSKASVQEAIAGLRRSGLVAGQKRLVLKSASAHGGATEEQSFVSALIGDLLRQLTPEMRYLLDCICSAKKPLSVAEVAARHSISENSRKLSQQLAWLCRRGFVRKLGERFAVTDAYASAIAI